MSDSNLKRVELVPRFPSRDIFLEDHLVEKGQKERSIEVIKVPFYKIESSEGRLGPDLLADVVMDQTLQEMFTEPYTPKACALKNAVFCGAVSTGYLPGVTDNSGKALEEAFLITGHKVRAYSGELYLIFSNEQKNMSALYDQLKGIVANPLIQSVEYLEAKEFLEGTRFHQIDLPEVHIKHLEKAEMVSLDLDDDGLLDLSRERCLALTLNEMQAIKTYYENANVQKGREKLGLPSWPTDVEIEVLAQTWSEHCKHKIFASEIHFKDEQTGTTEVVDGLYKSYIKKATKELEAEGVEWLVSVFSDNAGIVRFDPQVDLCIKVETHNSPSALDPYGGAITGILGVNRDILGCGLGARPIANTDVFCFASTELPDHIDQGKLPAGLMEPAQLLRGVHKGVEDGGNKSGIPTVNGAIVFDQDYAGKPLVFCGTVGVLPARLPDGREGKEKGAKPGHKIIVLGGAVGADGIHGATFSSMELNEDSPATAVQIGDPITQKRVMDFLLEARDAGLYSCVTDNGAGGISSSIGEMAELTGGASIDLNAHPRKYPGLSPWEIMISESQERMTVAVEPEKVSSFLELSQKRGVVSTVLGEFTNSGGLEVFYKDERVAWLDMEFLHDGVPRLKLEANWQGPAPRKSWVTLTKEAKIPHHSDILKTLLHRENIASKDYWVRQYDHEVQGATVGKPFPGAQGISPGDSGVIDLSFHGGEEGSLAMVGCGLAPRWSATDPELMAKLSVDEAVRNIMSTGANPEKICLLDNFCWPDPVKTDRNPDGDIKLAQLVKTCRGLYDICKLYRAPLVSGKDSMKNDFRGKNRAGEDLLISIQPTLLVTALGHGVRETQRQSPCTEAGQLVYRFGAPQLSFKGSEFSEVYEDSSWSMDEELKKRSDSFSEWDFQKCHHHYQSLFQAFQKNLILACHDISDGGMAVALAEMLFDEGLGLEMLKDFNLLELFGEGPGQFLVAVDQEQKGAFDDFVRLQDLEVELVGETTSEDSWKGPSQELWATTGEYCKEWQRQWEER